MSREQGAAVIAGAEVVLAAAAVVTDLLLPSLVLCAMAAVSLVVRRTGPASLGLRRPEQPARLVGTMLGITVLLTVVHVVVDPVVNHVTGLAQDTSDFAELEGDLVRLLVILALSWTLAAVLEEGAFRGYLMTRLRTALGGGHAATVAAVAGSAVLFGLIHTEQGAVGVVLAAVDGAVFAGLVLYYRTLWESILTHGFANTIGLVAFYVAGPVPALW